MTLSQLPKLLSESLVTRPFLALASITHENCVSVLRQSVLYRGLESAYKGTIGKSRMKCADALGLHQGLWYAHIATTALISLLSTFIDTEKIAYAVLLASMVMVLRMALTPLRLRVNVIDVIVTGFFVTAFLSGVFSSYTATSLIGLAKFLVFYLGYLNYRALFQAQPDGTGPSGHKAIVILLSVLVILGLAESIIGLYQYINKVSPLATWQDMSVNPEDRLIRIFGTLQPSNPNLLAGFLLPCLSAAVGLCIQAWTGRHRLVSMLLGIPSLTILTALVLTGSRGAYLALLVMGVMTFFYLGHLLWFQPEWAKNKKLKTVWILTLLGGVLALVGGAISVPAIRNRFLSIFAMREDSSNSYRMNVWSSTIQLIKHNWLMGIGPGNNTFKQVYGLYMIPGYNALSAYSIFLEIWAEQGIFGILIFFLLIVVMKVRTMMTLFSNLPVLPKLMIGTLFIGIVGSVLYGLFDTIWYRPSVNLLFWLYVAAFAVASETVVTAYAHPVKPLP